MIDCRTKMTEEVLNNLSSKFSTDVLNEISNAITLALSNYDIKERCTDLTIKDNQNNRLLKRYMACLSVDGKSMKTIGVYYLVLNRFSEFIGCPLTKVGTYDIRFYLATMKQNGVSNRTLENYRSYISAFYQWLLREDFIQKNPCEKILPIKYKEEIRLPFSDVEIDSIRMNCKSERDRAIVELLLSSGIRAAEFSNLNIDDIDFQNKSIHIREGKGAKERISYITDVCSIHLKKYLESRKDNENALFLSSRSNRRLSSAGLKYMLREISKRSHVDNIHPHRFRRTFATNLARRGMDVQTIAKLMGHSNLQTTMIYVNLDSNKVMDSYKTYMV